MSDMWHESECVAFDRLTNCRMGSVEVMETFCYNLAKNTSLVELRLTIATCMVYFINHQFTSLSV